jgi:pyruvate/2-oxoglutarate dehydrogenase complex dihydrolipoamide dehydrogenase (E3) component
MSELLQCDIAIIGGGAGGLSVAAVAAQLGLSVVLAEANKMGGDCLNYGCIPSKSLIAAARSARGFVSSAPFGIEPKTPNVDFKRVMEHVANVINLISKNDSVERFTTLGVNVINAHAEFIDEKTIQAGHTLIQARKIVIASGSKPSVPLIPGLDSVSYLTNETIFTLCEKPSHLIVIGAGPIGCELAQAFCLLGIKVTLIDAMRMMPHDEPDLVDQLREQFICDGITLYEHHQITRVKNSDNGVDVFIEHQEKQHTIHGSHLLVATGRCPNITGLALEKAGIAYTLQGITVNLRLRTTNKRVYAIGDVAGGYQFTHIANYHAGIVIQNIIFKIPSKVDYRSIPWVSYTTPELAHSGLTAGEALKTYKDARVISLPFGDNDRARTEHITIGNIKVIVTKKGKILGCSILGEHAGELIIPWIMLIKEGKSLRHLTDLIIPYPTLSEVSKRIASEFYAPKLFSDTVRIVVRFLKYLG